MPLGALTAPNLPSPVPSAAAEIWQSIGQIPQDIQQSQIQNASNQDQITQLGQKRLAMLGQAANENQALISNPQWTTQVEQAYKAMGLPVPRGEDGQIDVNAMLPTLDPASRKEALGLPPSARGAITYGYQSDPELQNAPMATALNQGMINAAQSDIQKQLALLGEGKIPISSYVAAVKAQANTLGDAIDPYLDPSVMQNTLGAATDAHIAQLRELGVSEAALTKYRTGYLQYLEDGLAEKTQYNNARLSQMAQSIGLAAGRLQVAQGQLQVAIQNAGNNSTRTNLAVFTATTGPILNEYTKDESLYNQVNGQISSFVANAPKGAVIPQALLDQQTALKTQLQAIAPLAAQAKAIPLQAPGNNAATVTGQQIVRTHDIAEHGDVIHTGTDKRNGKHITQYKDGSVLYDDGTPAQ